MRFLQELARLVREVRLGLRAKRRQDRRARRHGAPAAAPSGLPSTATPSVVEAAPLAPSAPIGSMDLGRLLEEAGAEAKRNMDAVIAEYGQPLTPEEDAKRPIVVAGAIVPKMPKAPASGYCMRCSSPGDAGSVCACPADPDEAKNGPRAAVAPPSA